MSENDVLSNSGFLNNLPDPSETSSIRIPRGPSAEERGTAQGFVPAAEVSGAKSASPLDEASRNSSFFDSPSEGAEPGTDPEAMLAYQNLERHKREKKRKKIIRGAIAGAVLLALAGFGISRWFGAQQPENEPTLATTTVFRSDLVDSVSSSGACRPVDSVVVTPEIDGVIESLHVSEGQQVKEGDLLFTIKNDELDKNVRTAELALRTAENSVNSAQRDLADAQAGRSSYDDSAAAAAAAGGLPEGTETQGDPTQAQGDASQEQTQGDAVMNAASAGTAVSTRSTGPTTLSTFVGPLLKTAMPTDIPLNRTDGPYVDPHEVEAARIALENAQIELESAQEALKVAQDQAAKREVKAPKSGTIISMSAVEGAAIGGGLSGDGTGGSSALVTIADLSKMRVTVQVNEIDISKIKKDQKATVTFSALPDIQLDGKVTKIAALSGSGDQEEYYGEGGVVTYPVDILIEKPDPNLKPGMTASVEIIAQNVENVLIVPVTAVVDNEDGTGYVNVVEDPENPDSITEVQVKIVAKSASDVAIEPMVEGEVDEETEVVLGDTGMDDMDDGMVVSMGPGF